MLRDHSAGTQRARLRWRAPSLDRLIDQRAPFGASWVDSLQRGRRLTRGARSIRFLRSTSTRLAAFCSPHRARPGISRRSSPLSQWRRPSTSVVTLTHDPKLDDPALIETLKTPAFYIASLGGTRTHGKRLERLKSEGFDEHQLIRINGPAGLDIGSVSPSEIAISILAELTAALHGRLVVSKDISA